MTRTADRILTAVRELAPAIAARGDEIEAGRRILSDLRKVLRSSGVFRLLAPRSHGGLEIEFPPSVEILAELAAADGATGWTSVIGCEARPLFS